MARLKLASELGWMRYETWETVEDGQVWMHLRAEPKRLYALRPSFWVFAIRHLRLRPYRSETIENTEA